MRPDLAKVLAPLSDVLLNKGNKRGVEERRSAADALASLVRRAVPNEFPRGTIEKAGDNELTVKLDEERKRTFVVTPDTRITLDQNVVKLEDLSAVKPLEDRPNVRVVARRVDDKLVAVRIEASTTELYTSAALEALENLVGRGQEIVPIAAIALRDPDDEVRRAGANVLLQIATELTFQLKSKKPGEDSEILRPLYRVFRERTALAAKGVNDRDVTVRLRIRQAIEELASVSPDIHRPAPPAPEKTGLFEEQEDQVRKTALIRAADEPADSLFSTLAPIVEALEKGIFDTDLDARIAAIEALEMFRENAVLATPSLVKALRDPNMFVRWSAARALGTIEASRRAANVARPAGAKGAVDGLIRLLSDTDLDVQIAAAVALEPYGADAKKAADPLANADAKKAADPLANAAATGDPSFRLAAIHTLGALGESAHTKSAAAKLAEALAFQEDERVREEAARLLGRFGPAGQVAINALRAALKDSKPSVSRAASEALLSIPAPKPK
jgi:HEAT repeat protein